MGAQRAAPGHLLLATQRRLRWDYTFLRMNPSSAVVLVVTFMAVLVALNRVVVPTRPFTVMMVVTIMVVITTSSRPYAEGMAVAE